MTNSLNELSVLMADDDEDDSELFLEAVRQSPYPIHVNVVDCGDFLLKEIDIKAPDVVIVDINMPKMDGIDCIKAIRQNIKTAHLPVIAFSTSDFPTKIQAVMNAGATEYIVKPTSFTELIKIVSQLYNNYCLKRNLYNPENS